jgi:hypothetical protein
MELSRSRDWREAVMRGVPMVPAGETDRDRLVEKVCVGGGERSDPRLATAPATGGRRRDQYHPMATHRLGNAWQSVGD